MRYFWLNQNNNKLILFMNGWAMNESAVNHLDYKGFDILNVCDYREFDVEINKFDFSKYEKKYLIFVFLIQSCSIITIIRII